MARQPTSHPPAAKPWWPADRVPGILRGGEIYALAIEIDEEVFAVTLEIEEIETIITI